MIRRVGFVAAVLSLITGVTASGCDGGGAELIVEGDGGPTSPSGSPGPAGEFGGEFGGGDGGTAVQADASCAAQTLAVAKPKADIIFVIDASGSMNAEMAQVRTNLNAFAAKIAGSGLDYNIIVITDKASSPTQTGNVICVPPPLASANCADNAPRFHHINQHVDSTDSLDLILSTYDNADPSLAWNTYARSDAFKVFVEVSDDDSRRKAVDFDKALLNKQPAGVFGTAADRRYIFHSIVGFTENTAALSNTKCTTAENIGAEYQKLSQLTGGIIDSVCKPDYSAVLDKLATGIATRLACDLPAPAAASSDPTSLVVQYTRPAAAAERLVQVTDVAKCATVPEGWYLDNSANASRIRLCPVLCERITSNGNGNVEALVGCKAPPPR